MLNFEKHRQYFFFLNLKHLLYYFRMRRSSSLTLRIISTVRQQKKTQVTQTFCFKQTSLVILQELSAVVQGGHCCLLQDWIASNSFMEKIV